MSNAQSVLPPAMPSPEPQGFDDAPRKAFKIPKALKIAAGTAIGLAILAGVTGVAATQLLDQQKYKGLIVEKIKSATGYSVDWEGNIKLGMMPLPHAAVYNLSVKANDTQLLTLEKANVEISLSSLLQKKIDIRSVTLDTPVVTLTTGRDGEPTWLPEKQTPSTITAETNTSSSTASAMDIIVSRVDITNGTVILDNLKYGQKQSFDQLNATLRAETLNGPFDAQASTQWQNKVIEAKVTTGVLEMFGGAFPLQATLTLPQAGVISEFSGTLNPKDTEAKGNLTVTSKNISEAIAAMTGTAPTLPKGLDGAFSLSGQIEASKTSVDLKTMALDAGALAYTGAVSVDGMGEGQNPSLSLRLDPKNKTQENSDPLVTLLSQMAIFTRLQKEGEKFVITAGDIKTNESDITLSGSTTLGARPTVDLKIASNTLNLDAVQKTLNADDKSTSATPKTGEAVKGFAVPFEGRIRASVDNLVTGGKTYTGVKADIVSHQGAITLGNVGAALPDKTIIGVNGKIGKTDTLSGLDLKLSLRTPNVEKLMVDYGVTPPALAQKIGAMDVDAAVTGNLDMLGVSAKTSALNFTIQGAGDIATPLTQPAINALKFSVRHPDVNKAIQTFQPTFKESSGLYGGLDIAGTLARNGDTTTISGLKGKVGQTMIAGKLSATTGGITTITGDMDLGDITLPSTTTGGAGGVSETSASSGEKWSRTPIDMTWLRGFNADIAIRANSITQNMWVLNNTNFAFQVKDGTLTLNDVSGNLFGGRATLNGVIKSGAAAGDPLTLSGQLKANNVNAQKLLSAATGKTSHTLSGTIAAVDVGVHATGSSVASLIQTLGGQGQINGNNLIVKEIDAAQLADAARGSYKPLERAGSLFQSFQTGQTEFSTFNADFAIDKGIVNFSRIAFDGDKATLNSTGNVNLPAWTVDLKNTMTVKNTDIPPFDFSIRGPLDKPINSGGDIVNNYLKKKLEKKATEFLEKQLDGKLGEKLGKVNELLGGAGIPLLGGGGSTGGAAKDPALDAEPLPTPIAPQSDAQPESDSQAQPDAKKIIADEAVKALGGLLGQ